MKHVVYLDSNANELELILSGKKNMILRGAMSKKLPHGKVQIGDTLYFKESKGADCIRASGKVVEVVNSKALTREESFQLIDKFRFDLMLTVGQMKKYAGKRYLTLIQVQDVKPEYGLNFKGAEIEPVNGWVVLSKESVELILAR
jgi:hypothetical protein